MTVEKHADSTELTPLLLNNTIVEFRKIVEKAKLRCIQKDLQSVKKLKIKKGDGLQLEKNKRKTDRLVAEVQAMKKIKPDEVSKFALVNTKSAEELTKKAATETCENKAMHKLMFCNVMVAKIDEFRGKYPLWPVEVPFILQRLGLQYKSKNKKKMADQAAHVLGIEAKIEETYETSENVEKCSKMDIDEKKNQSIVPKKPKNAIKPKKESKKDPKSTLPQAETTSNAKTVVPTLKEGRSGAMEVRRLKLDEIFGDDIFGADNIAPTSVDTPDLSKKHKKSTTKSDVVEHLKDDPFFDTGADDESPANVKNQFKEDDKVGDDLLMDDEDLAPKRLAPKRSLRSKFASSLAKGNDEVKNEDVQLSNERKFDKKGKPMIPKKARMHNANFAPLGKPVQGQQNMSGENRKQRRMKMRKEEEDKKELASLHPSWQAKRKNNTTFVPSAGKKIKFDD